MKDGILKTGRYPMKLKGNVSGKTPAEVIAMMVNGEMEISLELVQDAFSQLASQFNKANVLPAEVEQLLGLTGDAQIKDALIALARREVSTGLIKLPLLNGYGGTTEVSRAGSMWSYRSNVTSALPTLNVPVGRFPKGFRPAARQPVFWNNTSIGGTIAGVGNCEHDHFTIFYAATTTAGSRHTAGSFLALDNYPDIINNGGAANSLEQRQALTDTHINLTAKGNWVTTGEVTFGDSGMQVTNEGTARYDLSEPISGDFRVYFGNKASAKIANLNQRVKILFYSPSELICGFHHGGSNNGGQVNWMTGVVSPTGSEYHVDLDVNKGVAVEIERVGSTVTIRQNGTVLQSGTATTDPLNLIYIATVNSIGSAVVSTQPMIMMRG